MHQLIKSSLLRHHILPNRKGFYYLFEVIEYLLYNDIRSSKCKMSEVYERVAHKHKISKNSVEKSIGLLIERSFNYIEIAEKYGEIVSRDRGKLTNKKFVFALIDDVKHRIDERRIL